MNILPKLITFCFLSVLSVHFKISAQFNQIGLYADSTHLPFLYGVSSGQPQQNGFTLWTYVESNNDSIDIYFELALDSNFTNTIDSGYQSTDLQRSLS